VNPSARAGLYGASIAVLIAAAFGLYVFATADVVAAALGFAGVVVFLTAGVLLAVVMVDREGAAGTRRSAFAYLIPLTLGVIFVALLVLVRHF
jgi:uncharacterized membrane protein YdcZ (DUF606 family)